MQVGFRELTIWSFLMASAHGAGLMECRAACCCWSPEISGIGASLTVLCRAIYGYGPLEKYALGVKSYGLSSFEFQKRKSPTVRSFLTEDSG